MKNSILKNRSGNNINSSPPRSPSCKQTFAIRTEITEKSHLDEIEIILQNINIVHKLNEFKEKYPEGSSFLAQKIIQRYSDIVGNNKQMENVYNNLLNDVMTRFNILESIKNECIDMKHFSNHKITKQSLDTDFFNERHVARYSGLIEIKKELLQSLRISTTAKKILESIDINGCSPNYKKV